MAKKIIGSIKLQVKGGQANPSPPIGPALGQHGVNIAEFCKAFNARTQDQAGKVIPVIISVYKDKSFDVVTATEVIEHLENPRLFLRDINRVLKPGGLCVLSTPNILNLN